MCVLWIRKKRRKVIFHTTITSKKNEILIRYKYFFLIVYLFSFSLGKSWLLVNLTSNNAIISFVSNHAFKWYTYNDGYTSYITTNNKFKWLS
jgi:hypothetical protein